MGEGKTKATEASVEDFIAGLESDAKRADAAVLDALFRNVTRQAPKMWGPTIIGYGQYDTVYASGRKVSCLRTGYSPRKAKHSLYVSCGCGGRDEAEFEALLARLGKYSRADGGCLYVNTLADIDLSVLEEMIGLGWRTSFETYPE